MNASYAQQCTKNTSAPPKERKHIILLDGTWNDETGVKLDGFVTNIVQLNRIFLNNEDQQIVRYHRGVGNGDDNDWFANKWGGITGRGVRKIVDKAYARFVMDWQSGDRIYIFGFSRGAAAARMLASKIHREGIPNQINVVLKANPNNETNVVEQIISSFEISGNPATNLKVPIEFLGVWDTVSAFGITSVLRRVLFNRYQDLFTNNHIADNIRRAVHLVSIDETRTPFMPSLMNYKEGVVHEVWFPGVHSDVGGSYPEDSLARVSLHYMIRMLREWNASQHLPEFVIDPEMYSRFTSATIDKAYFHFHGGSTAKDLRDVFVQVDGQKSNIKPKIHGSYIDICNSRHAYSVVEIGNGDKKEKKFINFQYMPFNLKVLKLKNGYEVVR